VSRERYGKAAKQKCVSELERPSNGWLRMRIDCVCVFTGWTVRGSNPVGARFSAPVETGPGAHPASYAMGTESFPGVKRPGRGVDHIPPYSAEVKERVELYLYSTSRPSWPVTG
jgi:hypothetical protein